MTAPRVVRTGCRALVSVLVTLGSPLPGQTATGSLPPTAPTQTIGSPTAQAGTSTATRPATHPARVTCTGGNLAVEANNSSLNQILRSVAHCTGLQVTGSVPEQRVFGNYGPAAPSTVLATLLDGTGSNMLLLEAANGEPARLVLTPRTGGPTPPPQTSDNDNGGTDNQDDDSNGNDLPPQVRNAPGGVAFQPQRGPASPGGSGSSQNASQPGGVQGNPGSPVTSPPAVPIGNNNVLGNPANQSPTASTYPTTNSVPLDSVATPSTTTPQASGIVDAPNPPAAGSDTAAALNGAPRGTPGTSNISPTATGAGGSASGSGGGGGQSSGELTPEQVFQQLQQRLQQQQQQQQQQEDQPQSTGNPQ